MTTPSGESFEYQVLLVEDDDTSAMLVGGALTMAGAQVKRVRNHAEATAEFEANYYDAVVSDLLTPKGTAEDFVRMAVNRPKPPRIVLVSALSSQALDMLAETYGVYGMKKPVDVEALVNFVMPGRPLLAAA